MTQSSCRTAGAGKAQAPATIVLAVLVVLVAVVGTLPSPAPAQESIPEAVHRMDTTLQEMDRRLREAEQRSQEMGRRLREAGQEAQELNRRLKELERAVAAAAAVRPAGGEAAPAVELGRDARVMVQRGLANLGFSPGPADGDFGPRTRAAVRSWQEAKGYQTTGALTRAQADALVAMGEKAGGSVGRAPEREPGSRFRDCGACPEMVVVPAGSFMMGSPSAERGRYRDEGPVHRVTIGEPFAVGVYEVTFDEWQACARGGGCGGYSPADQSWGGGKRPVINVSWKDAQAYVEWLSRKTGRPYRLPSESEWEYVARAGTRTAYWWGDRVGQRRANCKGCMSRWDNSRTAPVGSFSANAFGLHDVHGNVSEWVGDCWNSGYGRAPRDGSAWESGDCDHRIVRGGAWIAVPNAMRSAFRSSTFFGSRYSTTGFRVARTLD